MTSPRRPYDLAGFAWLLLLFFGQGMIIGGAAKCLTSGEFVLGMSGLVVAAVNIVLFFNIFFTR